MNEAVVERVRNALLTAFEGGYREELLAKSLHELTIDLKDCDADIEGDDFSDVFNALTIVGLELMPVWLLNALQFQGLTHRLLEPTHAIRFALSVYDGLDFLRTWNEGNWRGCLEWTTWRDFA